MNFSIFIFDRKLSVGSLCVNCLSTSYKAIHSLSKRKSGFLLRIGVMLAFIICTAGSFVFGNTITIGNSINWNAITTGSGTGGLPSSSDDIVISNGRTLTVNVANGVCASIQVGSTATTSGDGTLTFNSGSQVTVSGAVNLGMGNRRGTITMTAGGTLYCQSLSSNNTNDTFTEGTGTIVLTGSNTLAGTDIGAEFTTFNNLIISSGITTLARNTTIVGNLTINSGATLNLAAFTANRSSAGGTLAVAGTMQLGGGSGGQAGSNFPISFNTVTLTNGTVEYNYAGTQTIYDVPYYNLTTSGGSGTKTWTEGVARTVSGTLTVGAGTTLSIGGGYALNVTGISTINGTLSLTNATGVKTFTGAVTINSGGTFSETAAAALSFGSDVTNSGTLTENGAATVGIAGSFTNNGTYNASTGTHTFSGTSKTISGTNGIVIPSLSISNSITNNSTVGLTVSSTLGGLGTLTQGTNAILNIGGTVGINTLNANVSHNTVCYNGGAQSVKVATYDYLVLQGSGAKNFPSGTTTVNSLLSVEGASTATVSGTLSYGASAILQYKGSQAQTTGAEFPPSFTPTGGVIVDNASGVTLNASKSVTGPVQLLHGNLTLGSSDLTLSGNITGSSSGTFSSTNMVVASGTGTLQKLFTTTGSYTFPIGDDTNTVEYSPFTVTINSGTFAGDAKVAVRVTDLHHASDGSSTNYLTRYWSVSQTSITNMNASILGTFISSTADTVGYVSRMVTARYSTSTWVDYDALTVSSTAITASGLTNFGDFTARNNYPLLIVSPTVLSLFTYPYGYGPSAEKTFTVGGSALSTNITLTAPTNYEISTGTGTLFSASPVINVNVVNKQVPATTIYARMKAGLAQGFKSVLESDSTITCTSTGATSVSIKCSGIVTGAPTITVSADTITGLGYLFGSASSSVGSFTVSGANLSSNIVLTAPADYEISQTSASTGFGTSLTLTQSGGSLNSTPIWVRLITGLNASNYNENISLTSTNAATKTVFCKGVVARATVNVSTYTLGGFIYTVGSGPSGEQTFTVTGANLGTNILRVKASANFEISKTTATGFRSDSLTFTPSSGTVSSQTIYVRMKAGITPAKVISPEKIVVASTDAISQNVSCSGTVLATAGIATSVSTLNGFFYVKGNGPSVKQSFTVSATGLGANSLTITSPTHYEICLTEGGAYVSGGNTLTIAPLSGKINAQIVYVQLKAGLDTISYNSEQISLSSNSVTSVNVTCNGKVVPVPTIIASSSPTSLCSGSSATLSSTSSGVSNVVWTGPNNFYSTLPSVSTGALSTTGTYTYTATGTSLSGVSLVTNGNFELGNTGDLGFASTYIHQQAAPLTKGNYWICKNPRDVYGGFTNAGDHTSGSGYQMVVDGGTSTGMVVWAQTVAVSKNTDFQFTYYAQNVNPTNYTYSTNLQLFVNNSAVGSVNILPAATAGWTKYVFFANSGSSSSLQLSLINTCVQPDGNDFAIDDIDFEQVIPVTSTASVTVLPTLTPALLISASVNPTYTNNIVTFTATPTNGGTSPIYQWKVNGSNVGTNSSTFDYTPTATGTYTVSCTMTSNYGCLTTTTATSQLTLTVNSRTNYWRGNLNANWGNASNWTGGFVPAAGDDVEFATSTNNNGVAAVNNLQLDLNRTIGSLVNATSLSVIIPSGLGLIVNNTIQSGTNSDKILIQASSTLPTGSLIFHNAQNNPVYATVEMYSKAFIDKLTNPTNSSTWYSWQYFGIPVESVVTDPTFTDSYVRSWYEPGTTKSNHWVQLGNASILVPFYGYELCQPAPKTFTFKGKLVNKDFSTTLGYSYYGVGNAQNALFPGQHIFANPYTAAIDIKQLTFGIDTEKSVYMYNTGSFSQWGGGLVDSIAVGKTTAGNNPGQYTSATVNTAGANSIPRQIPSMQAMLIKAMTGSVNATFGIVYNSAAVSDTTMQRAPSVNRQSTSTQVSTLIDVNGKNAGDRMWVFSAPQCTKKFDNGWDAQKILGSSLTPQLYAVESDGNYQVNAVDDINDTQLAFMAGSDVEYTMTFTHENTKLYYPGLYLVDMIENKVVDITETGSSYAFWAESTPSPVNRFKIVTRHYEKNAVDETSELKIFSANGMIFVHNFSSHNGDAMIYDISGHYIRKIKFAANGITEISSNLLAGAYVVRCISETEDIAKRVIVR